MTPVQCSTHSTSLRFVVGAGLAGVVVVIVPVVLGVAAVAGKRGVGQCTRVFDLKN
jgi:hypothetical protein